jgi:hypothetical protein
MAGTLTSHPFCNFVHVFYILSFHEKFSLKKSMLLKELIINHSPEVVVAYSYEMVQCK